MGAEDRRKRKRIKLAAGALVLFLAYYGIPLAPLKGPVQRHLTEKYGIHVEVGSVRLSVRGLIAADLAAVWPRRQATLSVDEMVLGCSWLRSLSERRLVPGRMKWITPIFSVELRNGAPSPQVVPSSAAAFLSDTEYVMSKLKSILPDRLNLKVRHGKIHLRSGPYSALVEEVDAHIRREAGAGIRAWAKLTSRELGTTELTYDEGREFHLTAERVGLTTLSGVSGSPHKFHGMLSAVIHKSGDSVSGQVRVDQLYWTGPSAKSLEADTHDGLAVRDILVARRHSPHPWGSADTADVGSEPETAPLDAPESPIRDTGPPEAEGEGESEPLWEGEVSQVFPEPAEIDYIYPPLDVDVRMNGLWSAPNLRVTDGELRTGDLAVGVTGAARLDRRLHSDLDFYAPEFDEPGLERLSAHFHVMRFLNAFLETISSPSRLQAKMSLSGPMLRPASWRYEGLVDIRPDTFTYSPFLGQYSFLGTVKFNQSGVTIPEIYIPFGPSSLVLSGVAADYRDRRSNLILSGRDLAVGDLMYFYIPDVLKAPAGVRDAGTGGRGAADPGAAASSKPSGLANVDLKLSRDPDSVWAIRGKVAFRNLSLPLKPYDPPLRAYGRIDFTGERGDGQIHAKVGGFEAVLNPFFRNLMTPEMTAGVFFRQEGILWESLARHAKRRIPYLPAAGRGDVSMRFTTIPDTVSEGISRARRWRVDGTAEFRDARIWLPSFETAVESASGFVSVDDSVIHLERVGGILARSPLQATGGSRPGNLRKWTLDFISPDLRLDDLLSAIQPRQNRADPVEDFEVAATVSADRLRFRAFDFPMSRGRFYLAPENFTIQVDTPVLTHYRAAGPNSSLSEITFMRDQPMSLTNMFRAGSGINGSVRGELHLKAPNFSDTGSIRGRMDLFFDHLTFGKIPPLFQILDLMRFSLTDAVVFSPFAYSSDIESGGVKLDLDLPSNAGRWRIRGRLGLDAAFMPLAPSDSHFHVTFYPKENVFTQLLYETRILSLFAGRREGVVLDFSLLGNYNKPNILWTEEPLVSIIRGRLSELVPGFLGAQGSSSQDTGRKPAKGVVPPE
ncbi:hypothetical protein HY522_10990 [bacterium]|nr:hypothetical protein [bacterium]